MECGKLPAAGAGTRIYAECKLIKFPNDGNNNRNILLDRDMQRDKVPKGGGAREFQLKNRTRAVTRDIAGELSERWISPNYAHQNARRNFTRVTFLIYRISGLPRGNRHCRNVLRENFDAVIVHNRAYTVRTFATARRAQNTFPRSAYVSAISIKLTRDGTRNRVKREKQASDARHNTHPLRKTQLICMH